MGNCGQSGRGQLWNQTRSPKKANPKPSSLFVKRWLSKAKWGMSESLTSDSDTYDPPICHLSLSFSFSRSQQPLTKSQPLIIIFSLYYLSSPSNLLLIIIVHLKVKSITLFWIMGTSLPPTTKLLCKSPNCPLKFKPTQAPLMLISKMCNIYL